MPLANEARSVAGATTLTALGVGVLAALAGCGDHGGGDIATISAPQGRLWGARFAPAGDVIAIAFGDEDKIGTIDLEAGTLRELTGGGSYLTGTAWSPSGDAIYFNGTAGIVRISTDIGATSPVNDAFASLGLDVSADGARMAYGINGGNARVYTIATDVETTLARPCQAIRFAPDGARVACISGGALLVIDLATGAETTVIERDLPFIAGVDWYGDGTRLLFTSSDGVERIGVDGEDRHLVHGAFAAVEVDLAADEQSIVYGVNGQDALTLLRL